MSRDSLVIELLMDRYSTDDPTRREAAAVLLDLCRDGMGRADIAAAIDLAAQRLPADFAAALRIAAAEHGI
jgi:hypothetical protein